jgi:hypothetical protein
MKTKKAKKALLIVLLIILIIILGNISEKASSIILYGIAIVIFFRNPLLFSEWVKKSKSEKKEFLIFWGIFFGIWTLGTITIAQDNNRLLPFFKFTNKVAANYAASTVWALLPIMEIALVFLMAIWLWGKIKMKK